MRVCDCCLQGIVTDDDGELSGINSTVNGKECVLKCKSIFASPDYFPDKVEKKGDIARCYWCVSPPHRIEAMPNVPHTVASVAGRQPSRRGRLQGCRLLACIRLENNKKEKKVRS